MDHTGFHMGSLASPALDRYLPNYEVNEVHAVDLSIAPEDAIERVMRLPVGSDAIVRTLFRLRGVPGAELPMERFAGEILGLDAVERTATRAVAVGRLRGVEVGISFEAEPRPGGGSRLVTETRVGNAGLAFRLYWLVVRPFSALIRRRWLRAVARDGEPSRVRRPA
jgi:hypothetical protein